jgi:hypothetical protein
MAATYEEDIPIWENKIVRSSPALCDADGPIGLLRSWYEKFTSEADADPARDRLLEVGRLAHRRNDVA